MTFSPEYTPGSAIPRNDEVQAKDIIEASQPEQIANSEKELAALESLNQAGQHIIENSAGDTEVVEMLHLLGSELDIVAYHNTGKEFNPESKKNLLKRALRAAATAAKEEIGRG